MKTAGHVAVWIYLLLNAARKETDILYSGRRVTIGPGQLLTSRAKLCSITKKEPMTARNIRTILEDFEREGQITMEGSAGGTLITITKWAEYQTGDQPPTNVINRSPTNQKAGHGIPTDGETTGETAGRKNDKGLVTDQPLGELSTGQPTNHRPTTDQHNKNERNKENNNNNIIYNNSPATNARARDEAAGSGEASGEQKPLAYIKRNPTEEDADAFFEYFKTHPGTKIKLHSEEELHRDYDVRFIDTPDGTPAPTHRG
jgi:hypothetical protein